MVNVYNTYLDSHIYIKYTIAYSDREMITDIVHVGSLLITVARWSDAQYLNWNIDLVNCMMMIFSMFNVPY